MADEILDKRIASFITAHHVLTLATASDGQPWCANMFYAFDPHLVELIFSSADSSRHIAEAGVSDRVACSIVLESRVVGRLQGAQISGRLVEAVGDELERARKLYLKRFPYAVLHLDKLWVVKIDDIKLTDNTLGFGKKLYYAKTHNMV